MVFLGKGRSTIAAIVMASCVAASAMAEPPKQLTTDDYAQAEKFMNYNVNPLVYHGVDHPTWLADGRFWYRDRGPEGVTFVLVDPAKGTKGPAFDHVKLASALAAVSNGRTTADAHHLAITDFTLSGETVVASLGSRQFRCDLSGKGVCTPVAAQRKAEGSAPPARPAGGRNRAASELSPDKTKAAFIRDYNLWVRDVATGKETQLTTDGVKDYGYATDNAGWQQSDSAILVWSPDSKKIATFQQDQRKVGEMYLVPVTNGHPQLKAWKYPLVGDKDVTMIERVIIDVDAPKVIRLKMPPDQHRSTLCDDISCRGGSGWDDVQWSSDGAHLAFVSTSRDHKQEWFRVADASTGDSPRSDGRDRAQVLRERQRQGELALSAQVQRDPLVQRARQLGPDVPLRPHHRQAQEPDHSRRRQRHTGPLTSTKPRASSTSSPSAKSRAAIPTSPHYYSVNFDGTGQKLLTPENADHAITPSPDGRYFVDVYSTPNPAADRSCPRHDTAKSSSMSPSRTSRSW